MSVDLFAPERPRGVRPWRLVGGAAIALLSYVPAFAWWALVYLTMDDLDITVIELGELAVMFALVGVSCLVSMATGVWQVARADLGVGIGLIAGWAVWFAGVALVVAVR
ncbi:hypothetical protein [Dactylosporangium darangshiense]|uniref:Uncharacterized protein n=1 Tax=Dactylosporangium darangshiense TaxID=579108 RepID=A0ABP8D950_9ACTN